MASECTLRAPADWADFNLPAADGALVKAALVLLGFLRPSDASARDGVRRTTAGEASGCEVETWSTLPQGSGLGTSSILAGTVLAALLRAAHRAVSDQALCHLVLQLEQTLTTGGGYQDQVGGLWPGGVKLCLSAQGLPLAVDVAHVADAPEEQEACNAFLERSLFVVYTGTTRLAKNLLMRVLRRWALREPGVTDTVALLRGCAVECAAAIRARDAERVGRCLEHYWTLKCRMAPDAEPERVTLLRQVLRPFVHGSALAGAGGGGYLVAVAKGPLSLPAVRRALDNDARTMGMRWSTHAVTIDRKGLEISFDTN